MTERSATVRVNVTGNASAELAKLDQATKRVGASSAATSAKVTSNSRAIDTSARAAAAATPKVDKLTGSNTRLSGSFTKASSASISAAVKFKETSNALTKFGDTNKRAAASLDLVTRSTEKANTAVRQFSTNSRIQPPTRALTVWERLAATMRSAAASARAVAGTSVDVSGAARGAGRAIVGRAGAVGAAAVTGAVAMGRHAQGVLGIRSQEEILSAAIDQRQAFISQTATAGVSQGNRDQLLAGANDIGRRTGVSPQALTDMLMNQQELYSVIGNASDRGSVGMSSLLSETEAFANIARATGSDVNDVASAGNAMRDQFGLTSEQMVNSMYQLSQGAQDGSLSMRDFAQQFPQVFGTFLTARGEGGRGEAGTAEVSAVAQSIRRQQGSGPEAAARTRTLLASMLTNISDVHVQQRLRRAGVNVTDDAGNIRPIAEIAQQMTGNRRMRTSTQKRSIFGDAEATSAWNAIIAQETDARNGVDGAMSLTDRQAATAAQGKAGIDQSISALNADASGRAVMARAGREANVLGDSERLINAMVDLAAPLTGLQDQFPRLSMAMESLLPVLQAMAPGIGSSVLGSGATAAGAAAGAGGVASGAAGAAGTAAAGLGAEALAAGSVGVGSAGAGAIGLALLPGILAFGGLTAAMGTGNDVKDFFTGNFTLGGDAANGGTREEIQARVRAAAASRQANGGNTNPAAAATDGTSAIVGATNSQTQAIVTGLRNVQNAVANSPAGRPADAPP